MSSDQDVSPMSARGSDVTDEFWSPSPSSSDVSSNETESDDSDTPVPPLARNPFRTCTLSPSSEREEYPSPAGRTPTPPPPARASPRPTWLNEFDKLKKLEADVKTARQKLKIEKRNHEET